MQILGGDGRMNSFIHLLLKWQEKHEDFALCIQAIVR
jgi:hypothetical protein